MVAAKSSAAETNAASNFERPPARPSYVKFKNSFQFLFKFLSFSTPPRPSPGPSFVKFGNICFSIFFLLSHPILPAHSSPAPSRGPALSNLKILFQLFSIYFHIFFILSPSPSTPSLPPLSSSNCQCVHIKCQFSSYIILYKL